MHTEHVCGHNTPCGTYSRDLGLETAKEGLGMREGGGREDHPGVWSGAPTLRLCPFVTSSQQTR